MGRIEPGAAGMGLRERGKRERLRRLRESAAEVFRTRGYDAATTREIAQQADVAVGTLFVYARDKRDLLLLVVNDDLDAALQHAQAAARQPAPLLDQMLVLLRPIWEYFASEPELARPALREFVYFDRLGSTPGEQALRYIRRLDTWQQAIAELLTAAHRAGTLRLDDPAPLLARVLFSVHLVEVRRWMSTDQPDPEEGLAGLRRLLAVALGGRMT